jgi:hypothetical protein
MLIDSVKIYIYLHTTLVRLVNHQTVNIYGHDMWKVGSTSISEGVVSGYFHNIAALVPVKCPQYTLGMDEMDHIKSLDKGNPVES